MVEVVTTRGVRTHHVLWFFGVVAVVFIAFGSWWTGLVSFNSQTASNMSRAVGEGATSLFDRDKKLIDALARLDDLESQLALEKRKNATLPPVDTSAKPPALAETTAPGKAATTPAPVATAAGNCARVEVANPFIPDANAGAYPLTIAVAEAQVADVTNCAKPGVIHRTGTSWPSIRALQDVGGAGVVSIPNIATRLIFGEKATGVCFLGNFTPGMTKVKLEKGACPTA